MARFFIKKEHIDGDKARITGSDVRHINKVLRMQPGYDLTLVDDEGAEYEAKITAMELDQVVCTITGSGLTDREPPIEIILCQGLPKGDKLELIIQKSVELGVSRIIPVNCERTVVQLQGDKAAKRQERWQRVAMEAAKQSRRNKIPEVAPLIKFQRVLEQIPDGALAVIPWEEERQHGLKKALLSYNKGSQLWAFVGPEGGFSSKEIDMARDRGVIPVTLGPRILRTETAGITVLTMMLYQLGDLGGSMD